MGSVLAITITLWNLLDCGMNPRTKLFWVISLMLGIPVISCLYIFGFYSGEIVSQINHKEINSREDNGPQLDRLRLTLEAEECLLELTPFLSRLSTSVKNFELPSFHGKELFVAEISFNDLVPDSSPTKNRSLPSLNSTFEDWNRSNTLEHSPLDQISLWQPWMRQVEYFDYAKFYFVKSDFLDLKRDVWSAELGFKALARTTRGTWQWVHATLETKWQHNLSEENKSIPYRIAEWNLKSFKTLEIDHPMFEESLSRTIRQPALLTRLRRCRHEEYIVQQVRQGASFKKPHRLFSHLAWGRHPSISVIDLDRDGYDDLYILSRWEKNIFLRNRGDGTFEEKSAELGLDIDGYSTSAIFADFDNDGDADLVLGRTLKHSMYLENDNGVFFDRSKESFGSQWPALVTSLSAADYNGDGLLDLYFSTYLSSDEDKDYEEFYGKKVLKEIKDGQKSGQGNKDRIGPPNLLLVNVGHGKFEISPENKTVRLLRHTFQATWADYDNDGDSDLYVANDFAPNNLFRNDHGKFVDVTEETETQDIGFGMGASWGDFNNNGHQDLYVSNMYSKAGRRLTSAIPGTDPDFALMARGNSLLKNPGEGRFEHVSGLKRPALTVEAAGWCWCGQLVDFNNDGFLDIYALSGFYTSPRQVAIPGADL